jgi:hypothetical protein
MWKGYAMRKVTVRNDIEQLQMTKVKVNIIQHVNDHARAVVTGMLYPNLYNQYVQTTTSKSRFTIEHTDGDDVETLFCGVCKAITNKNIGAPAGAVCHVEIELISCSYLMDIRRVNRSFQDSTAQYSQIIADVNNDDGAVVFGSGSAHISTDRFIIQYNETNWEFLKRMASRFNEPLIADVHTEKPRYKFGVVGSENVGELEKHEYFISRNISDFRDAAQNGHFESTSELDFIEFNVRTEGEEPAIYPIGDSMTYKGHQLYIKSAETIIEDFRFLTIYKLRTKNGLRQAEIFNEDISGISLTGRVIDVENNLLKVHLVDIDKAQSVDEASWFRYATFYSTWYCMPERGDMVNLHFPNRHEEKAVVINSIKRNPAIGFVRT